MTGGATPVAAPPNLLDGFFTGVEEGELRIPRCQACERWHWYPKHRCPWCGHAQWTWQAPGGLARLFTWSRARRAFHPRLAGREGEVIAVVELDGAPGVRLVTNLVGVDEPEIGMALEVVFAEVDERLLPVFRPLPDHRPEVGADPPRPTGAPAAPPTREVAPE